MVEVTILHFFSLLSIFQHTMFAHATRTKPVTAQQLLTEFNSARDVHQTTHSLVVILMGVGI
jgi:hypothetical protein